MRTNVIDLNEYLVVERRGECGGGGAVEGPVVDGEEREEDHGLVR